MTTPRQPRTEQRRAPTGDPGSLAPVPLRPHPRLGDPRPIHPAPAPLIVVLSLGHCPAQRALRAVKAHRRQLVEGHIRPDPATGTFHQLLELLQERIDQSISAHRLARPAQLAGVAPLHPVLHRVRRTARQLGGRPEHVRQIKRFEYLHDLLGRLQLLLPIAGHGWHRPVDEGGAPSRWTPPGDGRQPRRPTGRQSAVLLATTARFRGRQRSHTPQPPLSGEGARGRPVLSTRSGPGPARCKSTTRRRTRRSGRGRRRVAHLGRANPNRVKSMDARPPARRGP